MRNEKQPTTLTNTSDNNGTIQTTTTLRSHPVVASSSVLVKPLPPTPVKRVRRPLKDDDDDDDDDSKDFYGFRQSISGLRLLKTTTKRRRPRERKRKSSQHVLGDERTRAMRARYFYRHFCVRSGIRRRRLSLREAMEESSQSEKRKTVGKNGENVRRAERREERFGTNSAGRDSLRIWRKRVTRG